MWWGYQLHVADDIREGLGREPLFQGLLVPGGNESVQAATTGNTVSLFLQNSDAIKAIQLKVVSNTPVVNLKEAQRSDRTQDQGWAVQYHSVSEHQLNVLLTSLGDDVLEPGEGCIVDIVFDVTESSAEEYFTLSLKGLKAADPRGKSVELEFAGDVTLSVTNVVNVEFLVNPFAISLSTSNSSEIHQIQFEVRLEGATAIDFPILSQRAESMDLSFEQFSDRVAVVLQNEEGFSIPPGTGEILEIRIQSSQGVRLVVHEMSLIGPNNASFEARVRVVEANLEPDQFVLRQNFPNPFNPSTTVSYVLKGQTRVALKVYDPFGQLVATLVEKVQPAGQYSLSWAGTDDRGHQVSSGTYFYRLTAGESSVTKKMILLK